MQVLDHHVEPDESLVRISHPSTEEETLSTTHPVDDVARQDGFANLGVAEPLSFGMRPDVRPERHVATY
jgi:hypothetical protein